jgi:hypothetical protein
MDPPPRHVTAFASSGTEEKVANRSSSEEAPAGLKLSVLVFVAVASVVVATAKFLLALTDVVVSVVVA